MGQMRGSDDLSQDRSFGVVAAAHELKAPVALIRQLALELETNAETPLNSELLRQIILVSERSLRLTSSLTRAASLRDQTLFPIEPVNAQQLCEEVAHELSALYAAHNRTLQVKSRRTPPLVIANRELLRRILLQFGDNALHYAGDQTVVYSTWQQRDRVQVGLRDFGIHTTKGVQTTGRPHSSGLGLQLVEVFAQAMNGNVGVMRHRAGMTFYVDMQASEQLSLL